MTLSPIVIPCRAYHARPGMLCDYQLGGYCATRESDTVLVAQQIADRAVRPAVSVRRSIP